MERISHWLAWTAVAVVVLFAGLNWTALTATTELNLVVMQITAPLGVILLGMTSVIVVLFFIATLYSRVSALMESRRLHKELKTAHELADKAEASRFEGLQQVITAEFRQLNERLARLEANAGRADNALTKLP